MTEDNFVLSETTRGKLPSLPFASMKQDILGKSYKLSLVFIGEKRSRKLNQQYRQKEYVANVLAFPLSKEEGEIFITPVKARKQAKDFGMNYKDFIGYLFIHALLHLKGLEHGSRMDKAERVFCDKFNLRSYDL